MMCWVWGLCEEKLTSNGFGEFELRRSAACHVVHDRDYDLTKRNPGSLDFGREQRTEAEFESPEQRFCKYVIVFVRDTARLILCQGFKHRNKPVWPLEHADSSAESLNEFASFSREAVRQHRTQAWLQLE